MSEINVTTIKNENTDYGPNLVGYSTVTGDLNVTGSLRVGAGITVSGITTFSDDITFDGNVSVGDSITLYAATGIITAAKYHGDGSELTNLPSSAGLGTALSEDVTSPLNVIYYTNQVLSVGTTITVDPPQTARIAYTQYPQVAVTDSADLIVAAGDDFIPDILGIGTTGIGSGTLTGDGGRVRADNLTNRAGTGAPNANNGLTVTGVVTATSFDGNLTGNLTGNVTATTGTFSGDVTIGGTLTYEDVTNVDSVGMITARKGIQVLADGINAVGVVTATSFIGDGSSLSGVESGIANLVATGTISNGATVVVNTDGTVSVVTETTSGPSGGSEAVFNTGTTIWISSTYDSTNNKVVIAYKDTANSDYGTAVVGSVSGTSITFGSPVVFNAGGTTYTTITYTSTNNKVVIAYRDAGNSNYGTAIVGTVSGISITFGKPVVFDTGPVGAISTVYDPVNDKVVISFYRSNALEAVSIVGTLYAGTSITFGANVTFNSGNIDYSSSVYNSANGKIVIAYRDDGNNSYGTAIVGTVSGTSITFGPKAVFNSAGSNYISAAYDSTNDKVVIAYQDGNNSDYATAIVGTVSGTSISFGSEVAFNAGSTSYISAVYDSTNNKVVIAYRDSVNSGYGAVIVGTVSGTSITFGSEVVFNAGSTTYTTIAYDSTSDKVVIAYQDAGNSGYGASVLFSTVTKTTNLTSENYIGIAAEAISNGVTGKINIVGGVNSGQSSLTVGKKYFVQGNGSLATTPTDLNVVAGTSIGATKIIVKG